MKVSLTVGRQRFKIAAVALSSVLVLVGCSSGGTESPQESASASATQVGNPEVLKKVTVKEHKDKAPEVKIEAPLSTDATASKVISEGKGDKLEANQKVSLNYALYNGRDGKKIESSWDRGQPASFELSDSGIIKGVKDSLIGTSTGSTVLVAVAPGDGYGPQGGVPDAGIKEDDTLVFVIETFEPRAQGTVKELNDPTLPAVKLEDNGKPEITIPEGKDAPKKLVEKVLIEGDGPTVEKGQQITVQYRGVTWADGQTFDSSWDRGEPASFGIGTGQVIKGWDEGLVGQKVGSQILLVIPPDLGYGDKESEKIPANSTLVFVVDIIAASSATTQK